MGSEGELEAYMKGPEPLGRKWKRLHEFINSLGELKRYEELALICAGLKGSYFEKLLIVKLAGKYKCWELIVEAVKSGEWRCAREAGRCSWMYGDGGRFEDAKFVVEELFPVISLQCRQLMIRMIGKHVKDERVVDSFFERIKSKYGFAEVRPLLPGTSKEKFLDAVKTRRCVFDDRELCRIFEKLPEFVLEEIRTNRREYTSFTRTYRLLASRMPEAFLNMVVDTGPSYGGRGSVGRKRVKTLVGKYPEFICKHAGKFQKLLGSYRKCVRRVLGPERYKLFLRYMFDTPQLLFQTNEDVAFYEVTSGESKITFWLQDESPEFRYELLDEMCKDVAGSSFNESWKVVTREMILAVPERMRDEIIGKKAADQYDESTYVWIKVNETPHGLMMWLGEDPASWIALKGSGKSVGELKKLLYSAADVAGRAYIAKMMIITCIANRDEVSLVEVIDFLCKRSVNDGEVVRSSIMEGVAFAVKNMTALKFDGLEVWDKIFGLLRLQQIYNEGNAGSNTGILLWGLRVLLNHGKDIDDVMQFYVNALQSSGDVFVVRELLEQEQLRHCGFTFTDEEKREMYGKFCKFWGDKENKEDKFERVPVEVQFFKFFLAWNRQRAYRLPLEEYPWLVEYAARIAPDCVKWFNDPVCTKQDIYVTHAEGYQWDADYGDLFVRGVGLISLLKTDANAVLLDFENIIPPLLRAYMKLSASSRPGRGGFPTWEPKFARIFTWFVKCEHHELNEKLVKYCLEILEGENEADDQLVICGILILSQILPGEKFLPIAKRFFPKESEMKMQIENVNEEKSNISRRVPVLWALKFLSGSVENLEAVAKVCGGDYLKYGFSSFKAIATRCPASTVLEYLKPKLLDGPVSLRKHLMRLFFSIGDAKGRIEGARALADAAGTNTTIRLEILKILCSNHVSSPSGETLKMFSNFYATQLGEERKAWNETVAAIFTDLPGDRLEEFLVFWMEYLDNSEMEGKPGVEKAVEDFYDFAKKTVVRVVDGGFVGKVVKKAGEKILEKNSDTYVSLLLEYILLSKENKAEMLERLEASVASVLTFVNGEFRKRFPVVKGLLVDLATGIIGKSQKIGWKTTADLLNTLVNLIRKETRQGWYFEVCFRLGCMIAMADSQVEGSVKLVLNAEGGERVGILVEDGINNNGGEILGLISVILRSVVEENTGSDEELVSFVEGLLGDGGNKFRGISAITLIGKSRSVSLRTGELEDGLHERILESNDPLIQCYYGAWGGRK